jgi:hypothetical protein
VEIPQAQNDGKLAVPLDGLYMIQAIVVKRECVSMEKGRQANQYRYEASPALSNQFSAKGGAKRQAYNYGDDLNRRGEGGNKVNGATQYDDAGESEDTRVPYVDGDSGEPSEPKSISEAG